MWNSGQTTIGEHQLLSGSQPNSCLSQVLNNKWLMKSKVSGWWLQWLHAIFTSQWDHLWWPPSNNNELCYINSISKGSVMMIIKQLGYSKVCSWQVSIKLLDEVSEHLHHIKFERRAASGKNCHWKWDLCSFFKTWIKEAVNEMASNPCRGRKKFKTM